ncbi:MAG TPA: ATP-binding protein [Solirubrobacteraceae bacterium]
MRPHATDHPRATALIVVAVPLAALGAMAGIGAGLATLACVLLAVAAGLGVGVGLVASSSAPEQPDEPAPHSFGVRALLTRAAHEARPALAEVDLLVDVAPPRLRTVGDPESLHRVIAELIQQAARRSPTGAVVTLAARPASSGVRLEVVDEGRMDDATRLVVAADIVDHWGGALRTERARPQGRRVVVELPGA